MKPFIAYSTARSETLHLPKPGKSSCPRTLCGMPLKGLYQTTSLTGDRPTKNGSLQPCDFCKKCARLQSRLHPELA
jgi:hypothetical protein